MERLSGYFRSFLLTLTFVWLPDSLIVLVTISSVVPTVVHSQVMEQRLLYHRGSEVFEHFYLDKKKMFVFFLFIHHSDFSCQVSELLFCFLILSLDRTSSNLAAARLTSSAHSKGSLGEERNPTSKYYR